MRIRQKICEPSSQITGEEKYYVLIQTNLIFTGNSQSAEHLLNIKTLINLSCIREK